MAETPTITAPCEGVKRPVTGDGVGSNTGEAAVRHGESRTDESLLDRLARALLDRGARQVSVEPEGARTAEIVRATVGGEPVVVWMCGESFTMAPWHVIGPAADPECAADRIIASRSGSESGR